MPPFLLLEEHPFTRNSMKTGLLLFLLGTFAGAFALPQSTTAPRSSPPKKTAAKKPAAKTAAANKTAPKTASTKTASTKKGRSSKKPVRTAAAGRSRQMAPTPERYRDIQQALVDRGYLKSEPNGIWDAQSADALRQFQIDQKLSPTGKISSASLIGLGLGPKNEQTDPSATAPKTAEPPPPPSVAAPPPASEN